MQEMIKIQEKIRGFLTSKRYIHSLGVKEVSIKLALRYRYNINKTVLAALLHDCARDLPEEVLLKKAGEFGILIGDVERRQLQLLHGPVGAGIALHDFKICDKDILRAICFHTTGNSSMTLLDKIIYIADYIEPNRVFPGVDVLRKQAFADLDKALLLALNNTINYVISNNQLIHPLSVIARNDILFKQQKTGRGRRSS
jgi:predicted HD superfamily hydrolase involved in NAD metabolism